MIISTNWLKKFTDIDISIDELTRLIGSRLVEIEETIDLGAKYKGVVVAKIVECVPLEESDHLNITKIDDGNVVSDVERDENGLVQVVCGAPNVKAGMTVAWLPPSSTVPETVGDKEPFVLGARKLRGVMSNGMLASAKELDLFDDHTGILEIDKEVLPGTKFADAYELNDYLLDIENKSLTHRPDTFGIVGFAREVAAIQGKAFKTPARLKLDGIVWIDKDGDEPTPNVTIDNPELSSRYQAVVLTNVDAKAQSPLETQTYLARVGVRPHSAVVDATNYLMMVAGQPLHAFDYDKLKSVNDGQIDIHVRAGHEGEKLVLIDDREIELTENDIVIANGQTAVALAGAMGGKATEIDDDTTNVLLESATFNLYNLRNTQMRHGIFSEAITRFTKGQPAALTEPVLAEAVGLLSVSAGAKRASDVADAYPNPTEPVRVQVTTDEVNNALGTSFSTDEISRTLSNVEFDVSSDDSGLVTATAPYWRADIHIPQDLNEEVGRLNGFDSIMPTLPGRDFTPVSPTSFDEFRSRVRKILARSGANEVLTYSFVHGDLLQKSGQKVENSYKIVNSISPALQYYRLTLTPSLLNLIHPNSKAGYDQFALFEINKTHSKIFGMDDDETPKETDLLALTVAGKSIAGSTYYQAKKLLDYLAESLGLSFAYTPIETDPGYDESAPFDYRRSAMVSDSASGEYIGIIGEYRSTVKKAFKLTDYTAGFELDPHALHQTANNIGTSYQPTSRYPSTERDICFQVNQNVSYAQVKQATEDGLKFSDIDTVVTPLDIYQPDDADTKNITLRIRLNPSDRTLNGDEVTSVMKQVSDHVVGQLSAVVV
ncbi:MAG: pheT [Candidatus Saccharibacteria bacterium]|nr:pheT [Candidatus Saccharibacteria bacterium]